MTFVRELLPPLKETSLWSSVYLIVYIYIYIYLYSFHNKYTMAFKIKSAKIFFWNKRTHSDVVVGSTLILAQTGPLQEINRKRKRDAPTVVVPASCESRQAPDKGHTGKDSCPLPGGGVAQGGRGSSVQPQEDEGLPDGATAVSPSRGTSQQAG